MMRDLNGIARDVMMAVHWAGHKAVLEAVQKVEYRAMGLVPGRARVWAVDEAVSRVVYRAMTPAVVLAFSKDPPHFGLGLYLRGVA